MVLRVVPLRNEILEILFRRPNAALEPVNVDFTEDIMSS